MLMVIPADNRLGIDIDDEVICLDDRLGMSLRAAHDRTLLPTAHLGVPLLEEAGLGPHDICTRHHYSSTILVITCAASVKIWPVGRRVGNVNNDSPDLVEMAAGA
jgi:hypothetical protein